MKKYIKPKLDYVQLAVEEKFAVSYGSVTTTTYNNIFITFSKSVDSNIIVRP